MATKKAVTVEAGGIKVEVDKRKLNDARLLYAMGKVSDPSLPDEEKLVWYSRMMESVFDDTYKVMCDLAAVNDGIVEVETYNAFFTDVMEAMSAKN